MFPTGAVIAIMMKSANERKALAAERDRILALPRGSKERPFTYTDLNTSFPRSTSEPVAVTFEDGSTSHFMTNMSCSDYVAEYLGKFVRCCYYRKSTYDTILKITDIQFTR